MGSSTSSAYSAHFLLYHLSFPFFFFVLLLSFCFPFPFFFVGESFVKTMCRFELPLCKLRRANPFFFFFSACFGKAASSVPESLPREDTLSKNVCLLCFAVFT